ncbi:hypothetical protein [Magnetococcus marinus]|uniref:hypothetical protein n=1 Tax=Magnetococcus marinus TaxID=1124597 RepID=UPI00003C5957|nr:hypothetical protein [Magnetococcus marinus]
MNRRTRYDGLSGTRTTKQRWPKRVLLVVIVLGVITLALQSCQGKRIESTERYESLTIPEKK